MSAGVKKVRAIVNAHDLQKHQFPARTGPFNAACRRRGDGGFGRALLRLARNVEPSVEGTSNA